MCVPIGGDSSGVSSAGISGSRAKKGELLKEIDILVPDDNNG